jgi:WD40 repeat protein
MKEIFSHKIKHGIIRSVVFTNDQRLLLYAYQNQRIGTIHTTKFTLSQLATIHTGAVYALAISKTDTLASAGYDRFIYLWDYLDHSHYRSFGKIPVKRQPILQLAFSPDSKMLASGAMDNKIRIWLLENLQCTTIRADSKLLLALNFSPKDNTLISGGLSGRIKMWQASGNCIFSRKMSEGITSATFIKNANIIATGFYNGRVEIWDIKNWHRLSSYHHKGHVRCLAVLDDTKVIVSGGDDGKIILYDFVKKEVKLCLKEKTPVCCVAFSGNKGLLAAGMHYGQVKLYKI